MTKLFTVAIYQGQQFRCHQYRHQDKHKHKMAVLALACLLLTGLSGCQQQTEPASETATEAKADGKGAGAASSKAVPDYDLSQLANADLSNAGEVLPARNTGQNSQVTTGTAVTAQGNQDFPLSSRLWDASLIELKGKNSEHATAVGKVMAINAEEYCARDPNLETDGTPAGVKRCVAELLQQEKGRLYSISANCVKKTVDTSSLGTFTFTGVFEDPAEGYPVEPWRQDTTGEIIGGPDAFLPGAQFELLCPAFVTWK